MFIYCFPFENGRVKHRKIKSTKSDVLKTGQFAQKAAGPILEFWLVEPPEHDQSCGPTESFSDFLHQSNLPDPNVTTSRFDFCLLSLEICWQLASVCCCIFARSTVSRKQINTCWLLVSCDCDYLLCWLFISHCQACCLFISHCQVRWLLASCVQTCFTVVAQTLHR